MKRLAIHFSLFAALIFSGAAFALSPVLLIGGCSTSLSFPNVGCAPVGLNFANNIGQQNGITKSAAQFLTTMRAETGTGHVCDYAADTSGNWYCFAANTPRITNQGLLLEESRTNQIVNSNGITTANGWGAAQITLTAGQADNFGGSNASLMTGDGTSNVHLLQNNTFAYVSGTTYTLSIFAKYVSQQYVQLTFPTGEFGAVYGTFDLLNGNVVAGSTSGVTAAITKYSNGWYRLAISAAATSSATGDVMNFALSDGSNARVPSFTTSSSVTIICGQLETNPGSVGLATSPILTTSVAVTRAADVVTLANPPAFGSAYTLYASGVPNAPTTYNSNQFFMEAGDAGANNRFGMYRGNATAGLLFQNVVGGTGESIPGPSGTIAQGVLSKAAYGGTATSLSAALNGGTPSTINPTAIPAGSNLTQVAIGQRATGGLVIFNGYIQRIALWPNTALTAAQLQAITPINGYPFLLKRDIDPASNDDSPMFLEKAA